VTPELWFVAGLGIGIVVAGFSAVGSYGRGARSVRNAPWRKELRARETVGRARHRPVLRRTIRS